MHGLLIRFALLASVVACAAPASGQSYSVFLRWCYAPQLSDKTITGCDVIIAEDRESPRAMSIAFRNRGMQYHARGEIDRAIKDFDASLEIDPGYFDAFISRGTAWHDKGDDGRALHDFEEAMRIRPRSALAVYDRGNIYLSKGRFELAIRDYDPSHHLAYTNRCWARSAEGPLETARSDCDQALKLAPTSPYALNGRGVTYMKLGDFRAALADFDTSVRLEARNAFGLYGRGVVRRRLGDIEDGDDDIEAAKKLHKDVAAQFRWFWVKDL